MREIDRSGPTPPAVSRRATPAELEATYRIVAPIARTLGRSLGLDETALDEVVQRVGLVLVEKRASYDPARGTLRSWGFGVACNVVHHVWTAANVEEQRAAHVPVSRLPSPLPTPEQSLRARGAPDRARLPVAGARRGVRAVRPRVHGRRDQRRAPTAHHHGRVAPPKRQGTIAPVPATRVTPGHVRLDYELGKGAEMCDSEILFRKIFAREMGEPDPFVLTGPAEMVVAVRIEADSPGFLAIVEVRDTAGGVLEHWEGLERSCDDVGDRVMIDLLLGVFSSPPQPAPPPQTEGKAPPPAVTREEFDTLRRATQARLDAQDEAIDELRERNRALQRALNEARKRMDLTYAISAGALMTANLTSNVGPGAWIGAEGRFGPVSMGLELRGVFPATVYVGAKAPFDDFEFSSATATLIPCGRYSYFFGCLAVGAGVEVHNDSNPSFTHSLAIFQIGGRLGVEIPFGDSPFAGRAFGEALYTLPPTSESYTGAYTTRWDRPSVAAFFGAGLVFKFGNEGAK